MTTTKKKGRRGFAAMDPEKQPEIARRGGAAVPKHRRSFSQDSELASRAGRKGGSQRGRKAKALAAE